MSINPLLPVLLALSAAGLLVRRREEGLAWAVVGLAGIALLGPALVLPDGVPSPSALLARHAPWQAGPPPDGPAAETAPVSAAGNPILRDVTYQVEPWLLYLRAELRAGRLPYWNPYQSAGSPYWGNGSSAPLFPLHLLFAALPLQVGLVLLPWLRLVVGGTGAWALARALGIGRPGALLAALAFPLAGMPVGYLLFPMGSALALVPWVLLAVERLAAGRSGPLPLAAASGLQLLAGHPETAVHTALVSAVYLLVRGGDGRARWWAGREALATGGRFVLGWGLGGALAAIQLLPLAATLFDSSRWQAWTGAPAEPPLALLLAQPLRLVLPELYGDAAAGSWWGPFNDLATSVYVGAATLPLAAAGLAVAAARARRESDGRLAAIGAVGLFSFLVAYHLPGLYDLVLHLPIAGRAAHHRLLGELDLALVLLAGAGLDRWRAGRAARAASLGAAAVLAALAAAWALHRGEWAARDLVEVELGWTAWVAAAALATAALAGWLARRRPDLRRPATLLAWALPVVVAADLLVAHVGINPGLSLAQLYPETGAVRFLSGRPERMVATGGTLHPNAAMVYRLYDVRGDDSVKLASYERFYGRTFDAGHPSYFRPPTAWPADALDRLAVRWVVTPPAGRPLPRRAITGARLAYDGPDARVWERPGALPLVRWARRAAPAEAGDAGELRAARVARRTPGRWAIDWRSDSPGLLVIAEAHQHGWRARVGEESVPVVPAALPAREPRAEEATATEPAFVGVRLPAGEGRLVVTYRPPWLLAGALLTGAGLVGLCLLVLLPRRRPATARQTPGERP